MKILVTGGCGYIGSHTIVDLLDAGHDVVSLDSNVRSSSEAMLHIKNITGKTVVNYAIDMTDEAKLRSLFEENKDINGVIHFAAFKSVGESTVQPLMYYRNNLYGLINLMTCVEAYKTAFLVFSSSCTVYGQPDTMPVNEATPLKPANCPYGSTKQMGEVMLQDFARATPSTKVCLLRYFNPAGAHPSLKLGEDPNQGVQSLTPAIVSSVAKKTQLKVFGSDYATSDGSCVRDFIHVCDIASAHTQAVSYMAAPTVPSINIFNLGSGSPSTVFEALTAFEQATSQKVDYIVTPRRPGDIEAIFSDNSFARTELKWEPKYSLQDIMRTAWDFATKPTA